MINSMTSNQLTEAQKMRTLHKAGAYVRFDMHLASENCERVYALAAEAQNGTTTDQMRAAYDRVGVYGFGF